MVWNGGIGLAQSVGQVANRLSQSGCGDRAASVSKFCAWGPEGGVGGLRKRRIPPESADCNYTLAVLWNSVVRSVYLSQMDAVASGD